MLLGVAMDGLGALQPSRLRLWPDLAIAAGLIGLAVLIMVFTARVWILYIAGCFLFALPKCLVVIATGKSLYLPRDPFSRLEAAELFMFSLASLFLIYRIVQTHTPRVVDRLAFTFFTICFVFGLSRQTLAAIAIWQILGLIALFVAWLLSRKKRGKHHATVRLQ